MHIHLLYVKMSSSNTPTAEEFEQMNPDKDTIVSKEDDEGITLEIYTVKGVRNTSARTYKRTFGHYFIDSESDCSTTLDEIINNYAVDNDIITNHVRSFNESFEVLIDVNDVISDSSEFKSDDKIILNISSQSSYMDKIDVFLQQLESEI